VSESRDENPNGEGDESEQELPPFDFNLLVLSLTTSALIHLGEAPDAEGPQAGEVNLGLARQVIDTLAVLEDKTRGNLTGEEERILHQALFDLRMRYARKAAGK
jgi:hypothetical protein